MANVNTTRGLEPSCGDLYVGKIQQLFFEGVSFYLGKTLTIFSRDLKNFKYRENVWILRLRDPKIFSDFIMISNRISVAWISIDEIIAK